MTSRSAATPAADAEGYDLRPDPLQARNPGEFMTALRQYRVWMGEPPFRVIARQVGSPSASTLCKRLNADTLPRMRFVEAFVAGCGGSQDDQQRFVTAWRTIRFCQLNTKPAALTPS